MRDYSYDKSWKKLLTPETVTLLTQINEHKGRQNQLLITEAQTLTHLVEIAKIQSTEASNKIEGISTSSERLKKILQDIQDGTFAKDFLLDMSDAGAQVHFNAMRKRASEHPSEIVGEEIRKLYSWNGEDKLINN